jgi:hypothetical protein
METVMNAVDTIEDIDTSVETYHDHIPNAVTLAAMKEAEAMINGEKPCTWYQSPEDLIKALKDEIDR